VRFEVRFWSSVALGYARNPRSASPKFFFKPQNKPSPPRPSRKSEIWRTERRWSIRNYGLGNCPRSSTPPSLALKRRKNSRGSVCRTRCTNVSGGAGEEHSIRANQESYQRIFLRPRVLRSVTPVDLSQDLFGRPLPAPVLLAPAAYQRLMHPEGELGSVRGANHHGVPFVLSSNGTVSIEEHSLGHWLGLRLLVGHGVGEANRMRDVTPDVVHRAPGMVWDQWGPPQFSTWVWLPFKSPHKDKDDWSC
jgi:hypothetical protein